MSFRPRRILPLLAAVLVLGFVACDREKSVAGRPASEWAEQLFENDPAVRRTVGDALVAQGPEAVPALVLAARIEHAGARLEAARSLGRIGGSIGDDGVRVLARLLADPNPGVRRTAIDALREVGPGAVERLERSLGNVRPEVRRWATRALAGFPESAVSPLLRAMKDADSGVRAEAGEALGNIKEPSSAVRDALLVGLRDEDWLVRERSARALAAQADPSPEVTRALAAARADPEALVRLAAGADPRTTTFGDGPAARSLGADASSLQVGAYYYTWFPQNWSQGYAGQHTQPPVLPALGEYASVDPQTIQSHLRWSREYGIDFWAVSWWPSRPKSNEALAAVASVADPAAPRFAALYESGELGLNAGHIDFLPATNGRMVEHFKGLAERYFDHPRYLRVADRPVVFVYITRTFAGDFAVEIAAVRAALADMGHDVFLVGDEVFWQVQWGFETKTDPHRERIALFDAITAYNPYESEERSHAGYAGLPIFLRDVERLLAQYREAAGPVPLIPGVLPGYNDRGTRLDVDHFVVPRRVHADAPEGSTFRTTLARLGLAQVDPRLPMLMVTSFNEWNEGSQIEPTALSARTTRDSSASGRDYTEGIAHTGYGLRNLEVLRDAVVALRATGTP